MLPAGGVLATSDHEASVEANVGPELSSDADFCAILIKSQAGQIDEHFVPDKRDVAPGFGGEVDAQLISVTITSLVIAIPKLETISIVPSEGAESAEEVGFDFEACFLVEFAAGVAIGVDGAVQSDKQEARQVKQRSDAEKGLS